MLQYALQFVYEAYYLFLEHFQIRVTNPTSIQLPFKNSKKSEAFLLSPLSFPSFTTILSLLTVVDMPWCVESALEEHQRRGTHEKLPSVSIAPSLGSRGLTLATYT